MRPAPWASVALSISISSILTLFAFIPPAAAYTFNTSTPTQCQDWTITWDGGTAPFYLMIVPTMTITGGRIQNVSLPVTGSPPYSHNFKLEQPAGLEFVVVLSDAAGWGTGGVSPIQFVSVSAETACLKTTVLADFYFYTEPTDSPPQCSDMKVTWNDNVTYPAGLHALIPGGSAWDIPIPQVKGQNSANWTVDIAQGTRFVLVMSDSGQYGTGGSTIPLTVQYSGNDTCLGVGSPRVTMTSTQPSRSSQTSGPASSAADGKKSSNTGAIAGGVVGGIVGLLILLVALWLCLRRRKRRDTESGPQMGEGRGRRSEETRSRLLGRLTGTQRTSGHSGGGRRPQSGFEIDVVEGQHPDSQSVVGEHSDSGDYHIQPYTYQQATGTPQRDSFLSTETDGSRNSRVSFVPLAPASAGPSQFGDKEVLAAALSAAGSTTPGSPSAHSRQSSVQLSQAGRGRGQPDLYTVSELALASVASGRPVDREELLAIIDPPPKYLQYDALRANNPDGELNNPDAAGPPPAGSTSSRLTPRRSNEDRSTTPRGSNEAERPRE